MFQLKDLILRILKLGLGIFFKFSSDIFYKSLEIAAVFAEKNLKFFLGYNNIRPFFLSTQSFVLC